MILLAGCKGSSAPSSDLRTKSAVAQEQSSTSYTSKSEAGTAKSAAGGSSSEAKPVTASDAVPESLRSTGYYYYGLDNLKPIQMKETTNGGSPTEGEMETTVVKISPAEVVYKQGYSGSELAAMGSSDLVLKADGIYTISVFGQTLPKPQLEFPAAPTPGKSWDVTFQVKADGHNLLEKGTNKIMGMQQVKIGDQTYTALLVIQDSTFTVDGNKTHAVTKNWFVKDMGQIKADIQSTSGSVKKHIVLVMKG